MVKLEKQWREFHEEHPEVAIKLAIMAQSLRARGRERYGIATLWETLRYETDLGADIPEEDRYKLNNNHRAYYARYLMSEYPELEGFFELRELRPKDDEDEAPAHAAA